MPWSWVRISLEAKYLQHLSAQLIHYISLYIYIYTQIYLSVNIYSIFSKLYVFKLERKYVYCFEIKSMYQMCLLLPSNKNIGHAKNGPDVASDVGVNLCNVKGCGFHR